ncbi:MAG: hypothetical protein EHM78_02250 [Myxococcaceae bacterium]|nr:MAG: hypothetical protein EHM78_02250 [Myxococcaceae bacterium]
MLKALLIAASLATVGLIPTLVEAQDCRSLRQACLMRDSLGERGDGNCRRFREQCGDERGGRGGGGGGGVIGGIGDIIGGGGRGGRCERLRRACMFKDERGDRGQGNCRRFREECS